MTENRYLHHAFAYFYTSMHNFPIRTYQCTSFPQKATGKLPNVRFCNITIHCGYFYLTFSRGYQQFPVLLRRCALFQFNLGLRPITYCFSLSVDFIITNSRTSHKCTTWIWDQIIRSTARIWYQQICVPLKFETNKYTLQRCRI